MSNSVLAFDYGKRRIGIATGSGITGTASVLTTLSSVSGEPDWSSIEKIIREWKPDTLIVGMPYNMDGSESEMSGLASEFATTLNTRYQLPVELVDERLSSAEASSILKEQRRQGLRTKKVNKTEIDSLAACLIAETWLRSNAT